MKFPKLIFRQIPQIAINQEKTIGGVSGKNGVTCDRHFGRKITVTTAVADEAPALTDSTQSSECQRTLMHPIRLHLLVTIPSISKSSSPGVPTDPPEHLSYLWLGRGKRMRHGTSAKLSSGNAMMPDSSQAVMSSKVGVDASTREAGEKRQSHPHTHNAAADAPYFPLNAAPSSAHRVCSLVSH